MAQLTIQQAFDLALQHHHSGRLQDAERLYQQILAQQPDHVGALHYLGVIAHQQGRNDVAIDLIGKAIGLNPKLVEAHNNLGLALKDIGQLEQAIASFHAALVLRPNYPSAIYNLGIALEAKGAKEEAIAAYRKAIVLEPGYVDAHVSLGNHFEANGRLDEAIDAYRQAVSLKPLSPEIYNKLGHALIERGRPDDALAVFQQAIDLNPGVPELHCNFGYALHERGKLNKAICAYRQAIALRPDYADAYSNLGSALVDNGQLDDAIAAFREAIALRPTEATIYNNLGNALKDKGQLDEAVAAFEQAIALDPEMPYAHNNLGMALGDKGQMSDAVAACRRAIAIKPSYFQSHSNLISSMHYDPAFDAATIGEEARAWDRQHAGPLRRFIQPHANDPQPDRRLRIGYVSPDFREHAAARFLVPLLSNHDHQRFEIFAYAQVLRPDAITRQLRNCTDAWRRIVGLSDHQAAELIRNDRIDILVDLAAHTAGHRLLTFAHKPAPVQVTWLGYPGTTGMAAVDYRLSDPYLDPPSPAAPGDETVYSEKTVRLPETYWCYDPLDGREVSVNELPAMKSGLVTFGCLNNFCKVNETILTLWARVIGQVERSRFLSLSPQGSHRQRTLDFFGRHGINPDRIVFETPRPRPEYLQLYNRIDISLDSFPYNGHTTSLDSFWMGVPVVTLTGQIAVSRAGWCQLSNLGLGELSGQTPDQFVNIATALANDLPKLRSLRSTLRQRMEQSPLMDAPRFARNIETAYREMWRAWCTTPSARSR